MNRGYSLLIIILTTISSYGQVITFEKNISHVARQLKFVQKLNKNGDSLILETEKLKIRQVDILSENYLESIIIDSTKGRIDLNKLSIGSYVIQARISRFWIVMYMEKKEVASIENVELRNSDAVNSATNKNSSEIIFDKNKTYWVVYEVNSSFSSLKTMGLKHVDELYDLISKIELESKTGLGKNNRLFIYEIYNKSMFMRKQLIDSKYYKSKNSKLFNVIALYSSEVENGGKPKF